MTQQVLPKPAKRVQVDTCTSTSASDVSPHDSFPTHLDREIQQATVGVNTGEGCRMFKQKSPLSRSLNKVVQCQAGIAPDLP